MRNKCRRFHCVRRYIHTCLEFLHSGSGRWDRAGMRKHLECISSQLCTSQSRARVSNRSHCSPRSPCLLCGPQHHTGGSYRRPSPSSVNASLVPLHPPSHVRALAAPTNPHRPSIDRWQHTQPGSLRPSEQVLTELDAGPRDPRKRSSNNTRTTRSADSPLPPASLQKWRMPYPILHHSHPHSRPHQP